MHIVQMQSDGCMGKERKIDERKRKKRKLKRRERERENEGQRVRETKRKSMVEKFNAKEDALNMNGKHSGCIIGIILSMMHLVYLAYHGFYSLFPMLFPQY